MKPWTWWQVSKLLHSNAAIKAPIDPRFDPRHAAQLYPRAQPPGAFGIQSGLSAGLSTEIYSFLKKTIHIHPHIIIHTYNYNIYIYILFPLVVQYQNSAYILRESIWHAQVVQWINHTRKACSVSDTSRTPTTWHGLPYCIGVPCLNTKSRAETSKDLNPSNYTSTKNAN